MAGNQAESRENQGADITGNMPSADASVGGVGEVSTNRSETDARIDALECRIGELQTDLARLRAERDAEQVEDYSFKNWIGSTALLSELFQGRQDLILIHNMGRSCSYCTLWLDGFVGLLPHLESRAAFVVVSPDQPAQQKEFATSRNWPFKMVSAAGSSFTGDMGFIDRDGDPMPGVSTFKMTPEGDILRIQRAEFGPGDLFSPAWHFFDLLDGGIKGWEPKRSY